MIKYTTENVEEHVIHRFEREDGRIFYKMAQIAVAVGYMGSSGLASAAARGGGICGVDQDYENFSGVTAAYVSKVVGVAGLRSTSRAQVIYETGIAKAIANLRKMRGRLGEERERFLRALLALSHVSAATKPVTAPQLQLEMPPAKVVETPKARRPNTQSAIAVAVRDREERALVVAEGHLQLDRARSILSVLGLFTKDSKQYEYLKLKAAGLAIGESFETLTS